MSAGELNQLVGRAKSCCTYSIPYVGHQQRMGWSIHYELENVVASLLVSATNISGARTVGGEDTCGHREHISAKESSSPSDMHGILSLAGEQMEGVVV